MVTPALARLDVSDVACPLLARCCYIGVFERVTSAGVELMLDHDSNPVDGEIGLVSRQDIEAYIHSQRATR